jgi:tetratricopeptide (TPR) repeat protein
MVMNTARTIVMSALAALLTAGAFAQSGPDAQLRYNVDYHCNGERVEVGHCRKDSDIPGAVPTTERENYCLVYYPDRPRHGASVVQASELRSAVILKLQACGALAGAPVAKAQAPTPSTKPPANPATVAALVEEGRKYFFAKDYVKAIEAYKKAVAASPTSADGYTGLSTVYGAQKQTQLSTDVLKQCIAASQTNTGCWSWLGSRYIDQKQYREAFDAFTTIINIKPDAALVASHSYWADVMDAHYWLAWIAVGFRKPQEAIPHLQQAIRFNADPRAQEQKEYLTPYASALMGEAYIMLKQYQDAIGPLQTAVRFIEEYDDYAEYDFEAGLWHSPNSAGTYHLAGIALLGMGKKDEALKVAGVLRKVNQAEAQKLLQEIRGQSASAGSH